MQIQITFDSAANRNAFAAKTGYASEDAATLTAHASLLALAKAAAGFVSATHQGAAGQVVVKSNSAPAGATDIGGGFYTMSVSDIVAAANTYESVEPVEAPVKLLSELTGPSLTLPLSSADQWARIRVANKYRPFTDTFTASTVTPYRIPELIVVDSGINFNHPEFAGLTTENFYKLAKFSTFDDEAGHGTGVASCAVGLNVGLTQNVKLVSVKVFTATEKPTLLELGQVMDAILARHVADTGTARVVNMSWNTPKSAFLESKIQALINAGIMIVAAAGNDGIDVAGLTPAGIANAITIGASDRDDVAAGFNDFAAADAAITTNSGQFLDFFAPGVDVAVANYNGGYMKVSGTSASAGFASGCLASMLGMSPSWPQSLTSVLEEFDAISTKGVLLLDPNKFSENQNRVVRLPEAGHDLGSIDYYLGALKQGDSAITGNITNFFSVFCWTGDTATFEILWDDAALAADYASSVSIDNTGAFTVNVPTVTLPTDTNLKLVRFKVKLSTAATSTTSAGLIFFYVNPNYDGSVSTEVASALEDLNSQSFFAAWAAYSLK